MVCDQFFIGQVVGFDCIFVGVVCYQDLVFYIWVMCGDIVDQWCKLDVKEDGFGFGMCQYLDQLFWVEVWIDCVDNSIDVGDCIIQFEMVV